MPSFQIALFLHILTLLAATAATAVTKMAVARRARARTLGEAIEWHATLGAAAKVFPICLAAFFLTGWYMIHALGELAWSTGFVVAGLVGVVYLLVSGIYLGVKGKALAEVLDGMAKAKGVDAPAPKLVPPPAVALLPMINTFVALAVAYDMVTRPTSIGVALIALGVGAVLGIAMGLRGHAAAPEGVPQEG